jgi:hypothetical protein
MKATIEFDDALYRRLKLEAVRRGRTVRELVAEGVRMVLDAPDASYPTLLRESAAPPAWFGMLRDHARRVDAHDMDSIRASIARGRGKTK